MDELKERFDKLIGGIRIQSRKKTKGIGTLACIVFDKETEVPLGLSNNHILKSKKGNVYQPRNKSNKPGDIVGTIWRKSKKYDCAVFILDLTKRDYDRENTIYGLSGKVTEFVTPYDGLKVQKVGQYTGHTYGIVSGKTNNKGKFKIKPNPDKPNEEISMGGDSGSLWVTDEENFKAVGLHTGGEKNRKIWFWRRRNPDRAYAIAFENVLNDLKIKL